MNSDLSAEVDRLSAAIRIPTVSVLGENYEAVLEEFQTFLESYYPDVFAALDVNIISPYALILRWEGTDTTLQPVLLLAHYDVVPAPEEGWLHPPFSGKIVDGEIWGRGAIDTKCTLAGTLEAIKRCIEADYRPRTTVYVAFNGDEELSGLRGAIVSARWFAERDISFSWLLDEGAAVVEGVFPGIEKPLALIGTTEKGYADVELQVRGKDGHSAFPPKETTTGILAAACARIEKKRLPAKIIPSVGGFLKALATGAPPGFRRFLMSHPGLFAPLIIRSFAGSSDTDALVRSTRALTILDAGEKENVLPDAARAVYNIRVLPGETVDSCVTQLVEQINDRRVEVSVQNGSRAPATESSPHSHGFRAIEASILHAVPDAIVAPFVATVATDSGHYREVTTDTYRLLPTILDKENIASIHGVNERISIDQYAIIIDFYTELLHAI